MLVDLCSALQYLHVSASTTLNGFNEHDVLVYSFGSSSKKPGARLRLSLANACREHDAAVAHPASLQLGMQRDVRSLGAVCASMLSVMQLKQSYAGPAEIASACEAPSLLGAHLGVAHAVRAAMGLSESPISNIVDVRVGRFRAGVRAASWPTALTLKPRARSPSPVFSWPSDTCSSSLSTPASLRRSSCTQFHGSCVTRWPCQSWPACAAPSRPTAVGTHGSAALRRYVL